jgi:hypothetical protein
MTYADISPDAHDFMYEKIFENMPRKISNTEEKN